MGKRGRGEKSRGPSSNRVEFGRDSGLKERERIV